MRTLSFSECVELKFSGSVLKSSICFADCDNDGLNELILGTTEGDLLIYRDDKCLCSASDLGSISAVAVGDLLNINRNVLVAITVEGWCHIFDPQYDLSSCDKIGEAEYSLPTSSSDHGMFVPFHSQRIVCNTKVAVIGDVNGDGLVELIVGLTDRVIRTYQWKAEQPAVDETVGKEDKEDENKSDSEVYDGRLYPMNKWEFASQIGSVSLHSNENLVSILVGQPGGSVTKITETPLRDPLLINANTEVSGSTATTDPNSAGNSVSQEGSAKTTILEYSILRNTSPADHILIEYFELDKNSMRNQHISTEVAGNVLSANGRDRDSYAVATTDGTVLIAKGNSVEGTMNCEHQILSLHQFNGKVVFVGWEGDTYVIDRVKKGSIDELTTRFHFEESIAAFAVGSYAMKREDSEENAKLLNTFCMAYVTFHEKAYLYFTDCFR